MLSNPLSAPMLSDQRPYALEITGKAIAQVEAAKNAIPKGTPINIAFLGNENHDQRVTAAAVIRRCGFEPVPIISSRRLRSQEDVDHLLEGLIREARPSRFIFVGGDPTTPSGPFSDSLDLLRSEVLQRHAISHVGIVAYPEGHPRIHVDALWRSLKWKLEFLHDAGCAVEITTQLAFDPNAVIGWLDRLRGEGIDHLVRIGIPGPAALGKLLGFARVCGVAASEAVVRKYCSSWPHPHQEVEGSRFLDRINEEVARKSLGPVLYHLYPIGEIAEAVRWMSNHLSLRHQRDCY